MLLNLRSSEYSFFQKERKRQQHGNIQKSQHYDKHINESVRKSLDAHLTNLIILHLISTALHQYHFRSMRYLISVAFTVNGSQLIKKKIK